MAGPPAFGYGNTAGTLSQPGEIELGGYRWRVAIDNKGAPLYRQRPAPFYPAQVSQGDMGEAQVSPDGRLPFSLRDLSGGGGLAQQPLDGDLDRYDRCGDAEGEGLDATLTPTGPVVLSARLMAPPIGGTVPSAGLAGVFWDAQQYAYLSMGRGIYRFDGAAVSSWGDLGAGQSASGPIVAFQGAQTLTHWYQPCGYTTPARYSTDGGQTWAPVQPAGGLTNGTIQSLVETDGEVVVATRSPRTGDAMLAAFDDGGPAPTLYAVVDPIGDDANPISRLIAFNGRILVIKDGEGVFLLSNDRRSLEEDLFPEWRGVRIYYQGATVWRGVLWLPTGNGLYAIGPGFGLQKVGPSENEAGSLAPRGPKGLTTAVDGDAFNLYAFRESPQGPSWVYKANVEVSGGAVAKVAWFPWSQQLERQRCRVVAVCRPGPLGDDDVASRPPRLVVDRQAQPNTTSPPSALTQYQIAHYRLPAHGRDPRADPGYVYAPAGTLYYARLLARFPAINKAWYGLTPLVAPLERELDGVTATAALGLAVRWKRDVDLPAATPPAYGYAQSAVQRQGVGERVELDPPLYARGFDVAVRLTTADPDQTPQLYSLTAEYDLRPIPVWRHEMTLDLSSGAYSASGRQGYGDPMEPALALLTLRSYAGASGGMDLMDLWGNVYGVSVPVDGASLRAASGAEAGYSGQVPLLVDVVAVEQKLRTRGTWRTVSFYRWGDLAPMTWRQVSQLG